jgi:hypothetical protein
MRFSTPTLAKAALPFAFTAFLLCALPLTGCGGRPSPAANTTRSTESTPGAFPATTPNPGQQPPPPSLKDPRTAVYSYLLWISYAYRVLNSDVASRTFDSSEEVRVNSYVMYNFQEGRAIDQRLIVAQVKAWDSKDSTATVAMHEEWAYRYISTQTGNYTTQPLTAAYETTYTLVRQKDNWLVHSVEASASSGPVK